MLEKTFLGPEGPFHGCNSPVIAHTPPQTTKGRSPVAEQSLGMYSSQMHHIVFKYGASNVTKMLTPKFKFAKLKIECIEPKMDFMELSIDITKLKLNFPN